MATIREIQAKFSATAAGMRSTIRGVTGELKGMQRESSTASQVMSRGFDSTGRSAEKFRTQIFDLEKRTESQGKTVEAARAEYEKMVKAYGENSKEAENAKRHLESHIASHKDLQLNLQNTQRDFKAFNREVETQSTLAYRMGDGFDSFSQTLGGISEKAREVGGSLTKYITLPVAGVVASAAGITAAFGWNRLASLDTAQAQLRGLGYETEDVERITENLVGALDGGMMTMADATFAAANAMAAGVEEGDELTKYIQMLDAAVVGGNGTFEEMQKIFSRVADEGSLTRREFDMMADRMPGFSQAVSDYAGASGDALYDMLNNGQITLDDFLQIMEDHGGDMAKEYAKTWRGMVENTKNYVGILGETMLEGVFEDSKLAIAEFIELLKSDEAVEWAKKIGVVLGDAFSQIVTWVKSAIDSFMNLDTWQQKLIGGVAGFAVALGPVLLGLGTLGGTVAAVSGGMGSLLKAFADVGTHLGLLTAKLPDGTKKIGLLSRAFGLLTGPVGWVITGITTLAGAFVYAYNKSEPFKNFVDGLVESFKGAIQWVKDFGTAISGIWSGDAFNQDGAMDLLYQLGLSEEQVAMVFDVVERIKGAYEGMKEKASENLETIKRFFIDRFTQIKSWWDGTGSGIFQSLVDGFNTVKEDIGRALGGVKDFFVGIFEDIQSWWAQDGELIFNAIGTVFENLQKRGQNSFELLGNIITVVIDSILNTIETFAPIVENIFNTLWPIIVHITRTNWDGLKTIIGIAMDLIMGIISGVSALIEGDWSRFGEVLKETAGSIFERVVEFFSNMLTNTLSLINELSGGGIDKFVEMRDGVVEWVTNLVNSVIEWWNDLTTRTSESFSGMVESVLGFFENLWIGARDKVVEIRDGVVDRFTQMKNRVVAKVNEIFGPTIKTFQNIYTAVTNKVTEIRITLTEIWNRIRAIISGVVQAIYENVRDRFMNIYTNVRDRIVALRDRLTEIWNNIRDRIVEIALNIYNRLRDRFMSIYNEVSNRIDSLRTSLVNIWNNIRDRVVNIALNLYNRLRDRFMMIYTNVRDRVDNLRNRVREIFGNMRDRVVEIVRNLYNRVSDWFGNIYNTVRDKMRDAKNKAVDFATDLYNGAKEQFENLVDGAKDMMTGIGNAIDNLRTNVVNKAKDLGRGIANAAIDGFNGLIKGINWVADMLGAPKIDLLNRIGEGGGGSSQSGAGGGQNGFIRASTGLKNHKGGSVLVGDKGPGNSLIGGGSRTREIIELPNNRRFLMDGDILLPDAPKGMNVLNNRETEKELDRLAAFNPGDITAEGGSGMLSNVNRWIGGQAAKIGTKAVSTYQGARKAVASGVATVGVKATSVLNDIMDYVDNPTKLFTDILGKYVSFDMPEYPMELALGGIDYLKDKAIETFKSWFDDFGSGGDGSHILGKKIYQYFGRYTGGISFNGGRHYGIDTAHKHEPLLSPVNGKVTRSWWDRGGGNSLEITTDKHIWWFMHLSKILKKVGDMVKAGEKVAVTGNTGAFLAGTGHLHTQVHPRSKGAGNLNAIDPLPILKNLSPRGSSDAKGKAGTTGTMANIAGYFMGGITNGIPELAWLNEEGFRESIISHNPAYRERSEHIWNTTGRVLGFDDGKKTADSMQELVHQAKRSNMLIERVEKAINNKESFIRVADLWDGYNLKDQRESNRRAMSTGRVRPT